MIQVDGKSVIDTKLEGSGKKFKVFGKRPERGYTRTLELTPGVRLVKVRVRSIPDKFDQTRIERFDLGSSTVAALRVAADQSGLTLVAERPPVAAPPVTAASPPVAAPVPAAPVSPASVAVAVPVSAPQPAAAPLPVPDSRPATATVVDFLQSLRSMLIGIAGFVASTATAFVVQEWLRSRKSLLFADEVDGNGTRRRRRRRVQGAIAE